MPRSKRARVVPTSKTTKNRKELVKRLHANIQSAADSFDYIWVFDVQNMRNNSIKGVRTQLQDCRIFMGKTKVMVHALGSTAESEHVQGCRLLTPHMSGEIGLIFTNREPKDIERYFAEFTALDYARAGTKAPRGFVIPRGELKTSFGIAGGQDDPIPMSIEPTLRKLGVPTSISKGKVILEESTEPDGVQDDGYAVCSSGAILDSRQTSLLKIFGVMMAEFNVRLVAVFEKSSATVREIRSDEAEAMEI